MFSQWISDYIGLPFRDFGRDRSGLDCWGLYRLVFSEIYGIDLPSYLDGYGSALDKKSVTSHIDDVTDEPQWMEIPQGQEKEGDCIVIKFHGMPCHVGLCVGRSHMLHVYPGINTTLEDYSRQKWRHQIHGFYRYQKAS